MANLVKYPEIQESLYEVIKSIGEEKKADEIEEEEMKKMSYLKAVVLEGLRRHPPRHLLLTRRLSEDAELGGYKGTINFMVGEMGRDPAVWEEPMEFKPERFMGEGEEAAVYITGSRGIKMISFGAGRKIGPGIGLAPTTLVEFANRTAAGANFLCFQFTLQERLQVPQEILKGFFRFYYCQMDSGTPARPIMMSFTMNQFCDSTLTVLVHN